MIKKIKRVDLFKFVKGLDQIKHLYGIKLAYAINKNQKAIDVEIKKLGDTMTPSEGIQRYEKERIVLCEKYCKRDEKGNPILKNNIYVDLQGNKEFEDAVAKLREKYKDAVDEQEKKKEEYDKLINEEIEFEVYKIAIADIPKDITAAQLEKIELMINKIEDIEKIS